jgi:GMP synthase-like glutamine amidotransferase
VRVLALIHIPDAHPGVFGQTVRDLGHELEECSLPLGAPPPAALDKYDAVMVFGGTMDVHEQAEHPWIRTEIDSLRKLLADRVPVMGICLGGQLLAVAAGASVSRTSEPEIGWHDLDVTPQATNDPLFGVLPARFTAFEWHSYGFTLPNAGTPLLRSRICLQAFRVGDCAWGLQFHPEVTRQIVEQWLDAYGAHAAATSPGFSEATERTRLERNIERSNAWGRTLCAAFLACADADAERSRSSGYRRLPSTSR